MAPKSRLWSEKDEINILRGLADHLDKHGTIPTPSALYHSISSYLEIGDLTKTQFATKIRSLKRKFLTTRKAGADKVNLDPRDDALYQLSSKVWNEEEGDTASSSMGRSKKKKKIDGSEEEDKSEEKEEYTRCRDEDSTRMLKKKKKIGNLYPFLTDFIYANQIPTNTNSVERDLKLVDRSKALILEERCRELSLMMAQIHLRRIRVIEKAMKQMLDVLKDFCIKSDSL